jgi:hypothetical protein
MPEMDPSRSRIDLSGIHRLQWLAVGRRSPPDGLRAVIIDHGVVSIWRGLLRQRFSICAPCEPRCGVDFAAKILEVLVRVVRDVRGRVD